MKGFLASALIIAGPLAFGQAPTNLTELPIWNSFQSLEFEPNLLLTQVGTQTIQNQTRSYNSTLYFATSTDPRSGQPSMARVELDTYDTTGKTPVLTFRAVGNGSTLYVYDVLNRSYSASFYSYYGKTAPAGYPGTDATRMLAQLYASTRGPATYLVNLLRQINPGNTLNPTPSYESWAPGETPFSVTSYQQDPILPIIYVLSGYAGQISNPSGSSLIYGNQWITYGPSNRNPSRSIAYDLEPQGSSSSSALYPEYIYFADRNRTASTTWEITITDPPLQTPSYAYQPYPQSAVFGWRLLSGPKVTQN